MKQLEMIGIRFGRLVVISRAQDKGRHRCWVCACDCGGSKTAFGSNLRRGLTESCGCLHRERTRVSASTHGKSREPIYFVWRNMMARCSDLEDMDYGGRGISVCGEWKSSFERFYLDMGEPPSANHTIDRIDCNGNYEKGNCRWATITQQARNMRTNRIVEHNGIICSLAEHCDRLSLSYKAVHQRLSRGWTTEKALTTPIKQTKAA